MIGLQHRYLAAKKGPRSVICIAEMAGNTKRSKFLNTRKGAESNGPLLDVMLSVLRYAKMTAKSTARSVKCIERHTKGAGKRLRKVVLKTKKVS